MEYKNKKIVALLPCYNEAKTITKVIKDFHDQIPDASIYVFDNNSNDGSTALAEKAKAIVIKEKRQGKGFVVEAMLKKIDADYYIMVDSDDTYPAEYCHDLLKPLFEERADMVVGQRLSQYEKKAFPSLHIFGNKVICYLINQIFHSNLKDPLSGYRAFTKDVALQLPIVASGFDIETEITLQMLHKHFIIEEIAVPYRARPQESHSKLNTFKDGWKILLKILEILRSYKPLTFFGTMFILCEIIALGFGIPLITRFNQGQNISYVPILLCSTLFIVGIFFAAIGIILNSMNFRLMEMMSALEKQIFWINKKD